jgi:CheY-like chemotaxis protein
MATSILVVEDDSLNRKLICTVLRQEGHGVVEACDGAQALELLNTQRFDLMITDFVMPKVNGLKVIEQVHPLRARMPILFITGYLSANSAQAILDGTGEVLQKPFEIAVLKSTVQRLLRN